MPTQPLSAFLGVLVTPNAKTSAIVGWQEDGSLKIKLAAKPVEGEANTTLIAFLAKTLGLPKSAVTLTHGATSRHKRVCVQGLTLADIHTRITLVI